MSCARELLLRGYLLVLPVYPRLLILVYNGSLTPSYVAGVKTAVIL
jgi:hypothetical protein